MLIFDLHVLKLVLLFVWKGGQVSHELYQMFYKVWHEIYYTSE